MPGTSTMMRRNRLPAWRCVRCEMVLFRYGQDIGKRQAAAEAKARRPLPPSEPEE